MVSRSSSRERAILGELAAIRALLSAQVSLALENPGATELARLALNQAVVTADATGGVLDQEADALDLEAGYHDDDDPTGGGSSLGPRRIDPPT